MAAEDVVRERICEERRTRCQRELDEVHDSIKTLFHKLDKIQWWIIGTLAAVLSSAGVGIMLYLLRETAVK